ncbi:MAG: hypothetical protein PUC33_01580 [Oscillospiraceae bacterium]|nr:hypothetical protein [Oscillospiraceae bacterium]MDD6146435.1 hypothetical protein [Oscillospiraceae bacterium]
MSEIINQPLGEDEAAIRAEEPSAEDTVPQSPSEKAVTAGDIAREEPERETDSAFGGVFSSAQAENLGGSELVGNFDELLLSLGIKPISSSDSPEIFQNEEAIEQSNFADENLPEEYHQYETYLDTAGKPDKNRKKFMQNFRVLSKKASDKTLLEAVPSGEGKGNVADRVSVRDGEDIFQAVERSEKKKKKGVFHGDGKSADDMIDKAKKRKREELLMAAKEKSNSLLREYKSEKNRLILQGVLFVAAAVLYFLPSFYAAGNPLEFLFAKKAAVYGLLNAVVLLASAGAAYDSLVSAFHSLRTFRPNSDTALILLLVFLLIQDAVTVALSAVGQPGMKIYTVFGVFAFAAATLNRMLKSKTALANIALVAKSRGITSIHPVETKSDCDILAGGLTKKGREKVLYCAKAETISGLNGDMGQRQGEVRFFSFLNVSVIVAAVITGIILAARTRDAAFFVMAIVCCLCLCGSSLCETARCAFMLRANRRLQLSGAAVTAFDGLLLMDGATAVAMDISDIFTVNVSRFRTVRGAPLSRNDAAVLAASVLKDSGSMLSACFDDFEQSLDGSLPEAEDLTFMPGLGYRATVAGRDVLLGGRKILLKHDIAAPSKKEEKAYAAGKCAMYLAVDGEICATFLAAYSVIPPARRGAVGFAKSGLILLLTSKEPAFSEAMIAAKLGSDVSCVKLLSAHGREIMQEYRLNRSMRTENSLICVTRKKGVFALAVGAHEMCVKDKFLLWLHVAGQIIAFAALIMAVLLDVSALFNPFVIIGLKLLWSAASLFLSER